MFRITNFFARHPERTITAVMGVYSATISSIFGYAGTRDQQTDMEAIRREHPNARFSYTVRNLPNSRFFVEQHVDFNDPRETTDDRSRVRNRS